MSNICFQLTWRNRYQIYPPALNKLRPENIYETVVFRSQAAGRTEGTRREPVLTPVYSQRELLG